MSTPIILIRHDTKELLNFGNFLQVKPYYESSVFLDRCKVLKYLLIDYPGQHLSFYLILENEIAIFCAGAKLTDLALDLGYEKPLYDRNYSLITNCDDLYFPEFLVKKEFSLLNGKTHLSNKQRQEWKKRRREDREKYLEEVKQRPTIDKKLGELNTYSLVRHDTKTIFDLGHGELWEQKQQTPEFFTDYCALLRSLCYEYSSDLSSLVSTYVLLLSERIVEFCKNCDPRSDPFGNRDRLAIIDNSSCFWEPLIESEYRIVGTRYMTKKELKQIYIRV